MKPDLEIILTNGSIKGFYVNNVALEQLLKMWPTYIDNTKRKQYKIRSMSTFKEMVKGLRKDGYKVEYVSAYNDPDYNRHREGFFE
jgi:hypothetical protein